MNLRHNSPWYPQFTLVTGVYCIKMSSFASVRIISMFLWEQFTYQFLINSISWFYLFIQCYFLFKYQVYIFYINAFFWHSLIHNLDWSVHKNYKIKSVYSKHVALNFMAQLGLKIRQLLFKHIESCQNYCLWFQRSTWFYVVEKFVWFSCQIKLCLIWNNKKRLRQKKD